jgi:hemin uptake protein HemP
MTHSLNKSPMQRLDCAESRDQNASSPRITSQKLFATQNEVVIEHNGEDYRLRITSNGKLILTK